MVSLCSIFHPLTHWGRVTHICVSNPTIIGPDNGLSPGRRQAIIWTNAGVLLIRTMGTHFSETLIEIIMFSFQKMRLKVSSWKWRPFCLGLNVLIWRKKVTIVKTHFICIEMAFCYTSLDKWHKIYMHENTKWVLKLSLKTRDVSIKWGTQNDCREKIGYRNLHLSDKIRTTMDLWPPHHFY